VIEISVVLAIMGLMLGGTLKGEALVLQAKIKRVGQDLNGLSMAIFGYWDRYKRLPGDDPVEGRWSVAGVPLTAAAGQGNGVIDGGYGSSDDQDETRKLWLDLRLAGFVEGEISSITTGSAQPLNAAGGIIGVQTGGLGLTGTIACTSHLPARIAQAIDSQFDDGNATTGAVRALLEVAPPSALPRTTPTENYQDNGSNLYVLCRRIESTG
jgi:hypothetical protein